MKNSPENDHRLGKMNAKIQRLRRILHKVSEKGICADILQTYANGGSMKKFAFLLVAIMAFSIGICQATEQKIGFVNFKACLEKSKYGKQEKNAFEAMKKQMSDSLEKADKELSEIAKKLQDQDYMDGLSPSAEEELKQKFQAMSQDFARFQNQYYQILNQANYKMLQTLHDEVSIAAEKVRTKENLSLLLSEDSTFAFTPTLDFTSEIILEMDSQFDKEQTEVASKE